MSPERDKTHRHGLTRQAACKGQPRARQRSGQIGGKAGLVLACHTHPGTQTWTARELRAPGSASQVPSPQGIQPRDTRLHTRPEGCCRISKCPTRSLLPRGGAGHAHALLATIPWHKAQGMQVASVQEPLALALPPRAAGGREFLCQGAPAPANIGPKGCAAAAWPLCTPARTQDQRWQLGTGRLQGRSCSPQSLEFLGLRAAVPALQIHRVPKKPLGPRSKVRSSG